MTDTTTRPRMADAWTGLAHIFQAIRDGAALSRFYCEQAGMTAKTARKTAPAGCR